MNAQVEELRKAAAKDAVRRVLEPIVQLLVRAGASPEDIVDAAKLAYLKELRDEVTEKRGVPASIARLALLSGFNRIEVRRLLERRTALAPVGAPDQFSIGRVLTGWYEDPRFSNFLGEPNDLPLIGKNGEADLKELVAKYSGAQLKDVVEELVRSGCISSLASDGREGYWRVLRRSFVPTARSVESIKALGLSLRSFLLTMQNNYRPDAEDKWFQQVVYADDGVPETSLPAFRKLMAEHGNKYIAVLDGFFAKNPDVKLAPPDAKKVSVGVGVYLYVDEVANKPS